MLACKIVKAKLDQILRQDRETSKYSSQTNQASLSSKLPNEWPLRTFLPMVLSLRHFVGLNDGEGPFKHDH